MSEQRPDTRSPEGSDGAATIDWRGAAQRALEASIGPIERQEEGLVIARASGKARAHAIMSLGMSERAMPSAAPEWAHAEVMMFVPRDWPLDEESWRDPRWGWPAAEVRRLSTLPWRSNSWLGFGHTIPNGDPPQPFAPGTGLCASFLLPPLEFPDALARLQLEKGAILNFWNAVAIYEDELRHKIVGGASALVRMLAYRGVSDVVNPARQSSIRANAFAQNMKQSKGWFGDRETQ